MRWMRQHSIKGQVTGVMVFGLAVVLLLIWLMNNLFLSEFYISYKTTSMKNAFASINHAQEQGQLYEKEYDVRIEKLCENENLSLMIISSDGSVVLSSQNENSAMMKQFFDLILERESVYSQTLSVTKDYTIQKQMDTRTDNEYLTLWGTLSDGNLILFRSAIASITDAAALSNRLLLYIGLFSLFLGVVLSYFAGGHITRPVYEMTEISKRMTQLDFEAKYIPRKNKNELDILGLRLNELSDALEHTIHDLKQANTELTRDLHLREESETMRREFISNVSHELKTPLALIKGYAEGLLEGVIEDEESRRYYLDVILDETDKMSRMVAQLLSLNRLEYGREQVHLERFSITDIINAAITDYQLMIQERALTVSFEQTANVFIWADPRLCEQVVDNYLSNAIHYASGEKRIDIRLLPKDKKVRFHVFNTGEPIPEDAIEHVWEKFYKVDEARTREYGGTGIGLSIVSAIAEAHQTSCGVTNYENGVAFWFDFEMQ